MHAAAAFRGPGRYVQGEGVLASATDHFDWLGAERALVAGGETALSAVQSDLESALEGAGTECGLESGIATCTDERVTELTERIESMDADLVVGVGGGTAIDAAKAAATRANADFASIPTVASTDAPASSVSVLYDGAGRTAGIELRDRAPELVLADTGVLASAPAKFIRYGLGDALSTRFEAAACAEAGGRTLHGSKPTDAGRAIARRSHGVIVKHGAAAIEDAGSDDPTLDFERAVEAVLLQSALGFENGGLAGAHALETGFRRSGITDPPHGLLVGFCTLAQLHLEESPAYDSLVGLLSKLGLTVTLSALGADESTLEEIAETACSEPTTMRNEPLAVSPADVVEALRAASEDLR